MQQLIDAMNFLGLIHNEVTFKEADHLEDSLTAIIPFRRDKDRIPLIDLQRHEFHEAVHLTALTALAAQIEVAFIALAELLRTLHNHRRDAGVDAAFIMNDGFLFKNHFHRSFLLVLIILYLRGKILSQHEKTELFTQRFLFPSKTAQKRLKIFSKKALTRLHCSVMIVHVIKTTVHITNIAEDRKEYVSTADA